MRESERGDGETLRGTKRGEKKRLLRKARGKSHVSIICKYSKCTFRSFISSQCAQRFVIDEDVPRSLTRDAQSLAVPLLFKRASREFSISRLRSSGQAIISKDWHYVALPVRTVGIPRKSRKKPPKEEDASGGSITLWIAGRRDLKSQMRKTIKHNLS